MVNNKLIMLKVNKTLTILVILVFAVAGLFSIVSRDTFAQVGSFSCYTGHEDGGHSPGNPIGLLYLDCDVDGWYWPNVSIRNDGVPMNCRQTYNEYKTIKCPGGYVEIHEDNGFCGIANGAQSSFSCAAPTTNFIDIGLRVKQADGTVAHIAIEPTTAQTSPLKIAKNGVKYTVALVPINDVNATKAHVNTSAGIKAMRICTLANGCAYQP